MISVDDEEKVLSWKAAAEAILGRPRHEAVGRWLADVLGSGGGDLLDRFSGAVAGEPVRDEIRSRRRGGGDKGVAELVAVPVEAAGHPVRALVLHDVTDVRLAQEDLERMLQAVDAHARAGGAFTPAIRPAAPGARPQPPWWSPRVSPEQDASAAPSTPGWAAYRPSATSTATA